jgi:hypothetical protein
VEAPGGMANMQQTAATQGHPNLSRGAILIAQHIRHVFNRQCRENSCGKTMALLMFESMDGAVEIQRNGSY